MDKYQHGRKTYISFGVFLSSTKYSGVYGVYLRYSDMSIYAAWRLPREWPKARHKSKSAPLKRDRTDHILKSVQNIVRIYTISTIYPLKQPMVTDKIMIKNLLPVWYTCAWYKHVSQYEIISTQAWSLSDVDPVSLKKKSYYKSHGFMQNIHWYRWQS